MPTPELIRAFLSQASATGEKSTALQPLGVLSGTLILGLVLAPIWNAPIWSLVVLAVLLCCTVVLYLASYTYFAFKNPDALRSEKFTLSKMAIEKNLIGDNTSGLLEVGELENLPTSTALPRLNDERAE